MNLPKVRWIWWPPADSPEWERPKVFDDPRDCHESGGRVERVVIIPVEED